MKVIELTHRIPGYNPGGFKFDAAVAGPCLTLPLAEAVEMIMTGEAKFFRPDGQIATDLAMLPAEFRRCPVILTRSTERKPDLKRPKNVRAPSCKT